MSETYESSTRLRPESGASDARQGMVINCAAYQGGRRVADIDLDQARKVDTSDGRFVWIGLHEPDQPLLRAWCSNASDCMISPSKTRCAPISDRSSKSMETRCSSWCARLRCKITRSGAAKLISSPAAAMW